MPLPIYQPGATGGVYPTTPASGLNVANLTKTEQRIIPDNQYFGINSASLTSQGWSLQNRDGVQAIFTRSTAGDPKTVLSSLLGEYTKSYNEGRQVNEQRFSDILGGYRDRYGQAMQTLQGLGDAARGRIDRQYDSVSRSVGQGLVNTGLYNSTIAPTMQMAVERDRAQAQDQLNEGLRRERLGYESNLSKETLDFMERRTDSYPNLDQLAQIALALGQSNQSFGIPGTTVTGGSGTVSPPSVPGGSVGGIGGGGGSVGGGGTGGGSGGGGSGGGSSGGGGSGGGSAGGGSGGYNAGYTPPAWNGQQSTWSRNLSNAVFSGGSDSSRIYEIIDDISATPWDELPAALAELFQTESPETLSRLIGAGIGTAAGEVSDLVNGWVADGVDALTDGLLGLFGGDAGTAGSTGGVTAGGGGAITGGSAAGGVGVQSDGKGGSVVTVPWMGVTRTLHYPAGVPIDPWALAAANQTA